MTTLNYRREKVYDPVLRIIHAWNGLAILFLLSTVWISDFFEKGSAEETLWTLHIFLGYALVTGLVARLIWGLAGPAHARFKDMWHPSAWLQAISIGKLHAQPRFGHHPFASGVYLALYLLLAVMAITGLGLAAVEHSMGPLNSWIGDMPWLEDIFEEPHEFIYNLILAFVVIHIAALVWHEKKDQAPLAQAMVSGYQYQKLPNESANEGEHHA